MRQATLVFLIRGIKGEKEICLAMKKRGFGKGRWNGSGGKMTDEDKTIESTAIRETKEEIGVDVVKLEKYSELDFSFRDNPEWNQVVHVYLVYEWTGDLIESEEMAPKWFNIKELPYSKMWPDDIFWLPLVLANKKIHAEFSFGPGDKILSKKLRTVKSFT